MVKQSMYTINENFFDIINEEQAYVLGWFWSRGTGRIQLLKKDADILETIRALLDYSGGVLFYKNRAELNITNPNFRRCLAFCGCVKNKHIPQSFPIISNSRHFIRGIFDSYGTICLNKNKYVNISITYDDSFISEFRKYLKINLNIETKHYYRYTHTNTVQMMITRTDNAKRFLDWMYEGANYYLTRKFAKYEEYLKKSV